MGAALGRRCFGTSPGGGVALRLGRPTGSAAASLSCAHGPVGLALGVFSPANDRSAQGQGSAPQTGRFLDPDRFGGGGGLQRAARDSGVCQEPQSCPARPSALPAPPGSGPPI